MRPPVKRFECMDQLEADERAESEDRARSRAAGLPAVAPDRAHEARGVRYEVYSGYGALEMRPPRRVGAAGAGRGPVMELDTGKARQAGYEVLALGGTLATFEVATALREAARGLLGLAVSDALLRVADEHEAYVGRAHEQHEWLGNTMLDAASVIGASVIGASVIGASVIGATDEEAGRAMRSVGFPA